MTSIIDLAQIHQDMVSKMEEMHLVSTPLKLEYNVLRARVDGMPKIGDYIILATGSGAKNIAEVISVDGSIRGQAMIEFKLYGLAYPDHGQQP